MSKTAAPVGAQKNKINHVVFVLDASGSMSSRRSEVVKVTDAQVGYLAQRSTEMGQETRVSVFTFASAGDFECLIYDMDVLRMPSLAGLYRTRDMTALVDATLLAVEDLAMTPEKYGDHAFLVYVVTDGAENDSVHAASDLERKLQSLADNWTLAVLVPNKGGADSAKRWGFPAGNIAQWDITSAEGFTKAMQTMQKATDGFMAGRAQGLRSSRNLFTLDATQLNHATVSKKLTKVDPKTYQFLDVPKKANTVRTEIRPFVEASISGFTYKTGCAFYQLTKPEMIQAQKQICVLNRGTGELYSGQEARDLIGLPNVNLKVQPGQHTAFDIFVQSTSVNRLLVGETKVLVFP